MQSLDASSILAGDIYSNSASLVGIEPKSRQERFAVGLEPACETQPIMIIDDDPTVIAVVQRYLSLAGFSQFLTTTDSTHALSMISTQAPDVILLDIVMPQMGGLEILERIRAKPPLVGLPVIILTSATENHVKTKALELGATDFLAKPLDPNDLVPRVRNALILKSHYDQLENYANQLEEKVSERTTSLRIAQKEVIECLAQAAEFRDNDTGRHVIRVGLYTGIIARQLGWDDHAVELIQLAAPLHDVGKIGIPDSILLKPGKLDPDEFEFIQRHCGFGKTICDRHSVHANPLFRYHVDVGATIMGGKASPVLKVAARIALTHHERWDGTGYPLGLVGEDIPIEGRITAVADVFDALSSKRPYKAAFPIEKCFSILKNGRGTNFDPDVLDAFFASRDEILATQIEYADVE